MKFTFFNSPPWGNYYKFLSNTFDLHFVFNKKNLKNIPDFDGLMSCHYYFMMDNCYHPEIYNSSNYKTFNNNMFHTLVKFISLCEKHRNMDDYILFLEFLLNNDDIDVDFNATNYEYQDIYECYTGCKYTAHIEFIVEYNCHNLIKIQRNYRRNMHRKKLRRSLELIVFSPPKQVEFNNFNTFAGGIGYFNAFENFYTLNHKP